MEQAKEAILTQIIDAKASGTKIVRLRYRNITVEEIKAIGNKYSKQLKDRGYFGKITCSAYYPELGWRTADARKIGDNIQLYDYMEYDSWANIVGGNVPYTNDTVLPTCDLYMYKYEKKPTAGKGLERSRQTHCFYDCLKTLYLDKTVRGMTSVEFKKKFRIGAEFGVEIADIPRIERKLHLQINVIGDHIYSSPSKAETRIKLLLKDGHYTVVKDNKPSPREWSHVERTPLTYIINDMSPSAVRPSAGGNNNNYVKCYDGTNIFQMDLKEFWNEYYKLGFSKYVFVKERKSLKNETELFEAHELFCKGADELKEATKGKINMYKTGMPKSTADNLLYSLTKNLNINPEKVEQDEAEWIEGCYNGGVIKRLGEEGKHFNLHKFDFCSKYVYNMRSCNSFPVKRGEFKFIDEETKAKKFLPKGIYRCIVSGDSKLFMFNKKNYYVNAELNEAKELGLTIEFINDGKPNMLEYSASSCVPMRSLFGEFVDFIFPLKQKGLRFAKAILTVPWGSVCQKNRIKKRKILKDGVKVKEIELKDNEYLSKIKTVSNNTIVVEATDMNNIYKGLYPRLLPFITAFARVSMYETLKDHIEHVKIILTDGFLIEGAVFPKIKKSEAKLGDLVYEGYYPEIELGKVNKSYKDCPFVKY